MAKAVILSDILIKKDNSPEVIKAVKEKVGQALIGIGQECEGYAKSESPMDTGRMRNSITFATDKFHSSGNDCGGAPASSKDMRTQNKPEELYVYVGTNVEYAVYQEYGDYTHKVGKKHFLRDAAANHADHYKEILRAALDAI